MTPSSPAHSFNLAAAQYEASRPSYPPALLDAIEELAVPLAGSEVADIGAGTGIASALPLAEASRDLITYAQSWQWTDTGRAVPEALRVLRPNGALAIWWNTTALEVP